LTHCANTHYKMAAAAPVYRRFIVVLGEECARVNMYEF